MKEDEDGGGRLQLPFAGPASMTKLCFTFRDRFRDGSKIKR